MAGPGPASFASEVEASPEVAAVARTTRYVRADVTDPKDLEGLLRSCSGPESAGRLAARVSERPKNPAIQRDGCGLTSALPRERQNATTGSRCLQAVDEAGQPDRTRPR